MHGYKIILNLKEINNNSSRMHFAALRKYGLYAYVCWGKPSKIVFRDISQQILLPRIMIFVM